MTVTAGELDPLVRLIRHHEGLRLRAYYCPAGVLTCGYGSTGPDIRLDTVWTAEQAKARMLADAERFARQTLILCPGLSGGALCAISDFAYNLGLGRLRTSTLRRKVNSRDWAGARRELAKWIRGGGRVLPGLVARRADEAALLGA